MAFVESLKLCFIKTKHLAIPPFKVIISAHANYKMEVKTKVIKIPNSPSLNNTRMHSYFTLLKTKIKLRS